jgi:hypothetical protein
VHGSFPTFQLWPKSANATLRFKLRCVEYPSRHHPANAVSIPTLFSLSVLTHVYSLLNLLNKDRRTKVSGGNSWDENGSLLRPEDPIISFSTTTEGDNSVVIVICDMLETLKGIQHLVIREEVQHLTLTCPHPICSQPIPCASFCVCGRHPPASRPTESSPDSWKRPLC